MGTLRITGGSLKGRRIEVPKGNYEIRPAMDRMRESVFSILGPLEGMSFLDLFAGSGIMGLEAYSRGAYPVTCVERDRQKLTVLIKNSIVAENNIQFHCLPVERFILRSNKKYSIIFCDPPFPYQFKTQLVNSIAQKNLLEKGGRLLIHYPDKELLPVQAGEILMTDERAYGRSIVRFFTCQ